ncbi:MAG TPA: ATP-grasp domain-containing protein, partial [Planctomycetota bacterium]|nr:ATP-grasp domain-containing protein [Planctomycetota bacterium]
MPAVVFAVPFAMENTMRFVRAVAALDGVRLGVVSQDPVEELPPDVRARLHGFARVGDALDPVQLTDATVHIGRHWGHRVDRLFGILEQAQVPLAQARERLGLPGTSVEAARNFREKARMKDVLRRHGLPCARHCLATSADEALAFARALGGPVVVKPPAGAGAKGTFRIDALTDLQRWLRGAPPTPAAPVLVEEFVVGREFSFETATLGGRHVFHSVSCYFPTPLEVLREPWIQWCVLLPRDVSGPEFAAIREAGPRALSALGFDQGISHMEWFQRPDGSIAISEVAARPPGAQFMTLLGCAHDVDFHRAWAELMVFDRFDPPPRRFAAGAAYLRGQGTGRVAAITGLDRVQRELGDLVVAAKLPHPGQAPSGSYEGEGFVILRHPN